MRDSTLADSMTNLGEAAREAKEHFHEFEEKLPPDPRNRRTPKEQAKAKRKRKAAKKARKLNR